MINYWFAFYFSDIIAVCTVLVSSGHGQTQKGLADLIGDLWLYSVETKTTPSR